MTEHGNTTITFASLLFYLMLLVLPVPHVGIESNFLPLSKASSCVIATKEYTALRGTKISLPFLFGVHLALKQYTGRWIRKMCVVNSAGVKPKLVHFCVISNLPQLRGVLGTRYFIPEQESEGMATDDGILSDTDMPFQYGSKISPSDHKF